MPNSHRRLEIEEVGDVTIAKLLDKKVLDETIIQAIGTQTFSLVDDDHRGRIVLDMSAVEYLSSAAFCKLITMEKKVKTVKGRLMICGIRPEIYEVFLINKTIYYFEIYKDREAALKRFHSKHTVSMNCPTHACGQEINAEWEHVDGPYWAARFECRHCLTICEIRQQPDRGGSKIEQLASLTFPTYESYSVRIGGKQRSLLSTLSAPFLMILDGPLDLFASESLQRAWKTLPQPRCGILDLNAATEITKHGLSAIENLCDDRGQDQCVLVLAEDSAHRALLPPGLPVFADHKAAAGAFELSDPKKSTFAIAVRNAT